MLADQTRAYISALSDGDLLEYTLLGPRVYVPDAIAFAKNELARRAIPRPQLDFLRPPIEQKIAQLDLTSLTDPAKRYSRSTITCQRCGLEAPTRFTEYHQNIGALVMRFRKTYAGCMCRRCNHASFRKATFTTLFLGWWGTISFFSSIVFLCNNIAMFTRSFALAPVPPNARRPTLDDTVIDKIAPHLHSVTAGLTAGENVNFLCRKIAADSGLSPGQVLAYIVTMLQNQAATPVAPA